MSDPLDEAIGLMKDQHHAASEALWPDPVNLLPPSPDRERCHHGEDREYCEEWQGCTPPAEPT